MIALRLLPLAMLIGTAAQAGMTTRDVPPPRALTPVGPVTVPGAAFVPVSFRDTPPLMYGSNDRYVPVVVQPRMSTCRAAALVGMMRDDDGADFGDAGDEYFADADIGGFDRGFFGR